jgi:hypothetical protein
MKYGRVRLHQADRASQCNQNSRFLDILQTSHQSSLRWLVANLFQTRIYKIQNSHERGGIKMSKYPCNLQSLNSWAYIKYLSKTFTGSLYRLFGPRCILVTVSHPKKRVCALPMSQVIAWASDSFGSITGFGSSCNSTQSDPDKAWCYAKHVVDGIHPHQQHHQQQRKLLLSDDDGWFTASEYSDDDYNNETDDDTTVDGSNREYEEDAEDCSQKHCAARQKHKFRPRFGRQSSVTSMSSTNDTKENKKIDRKKVATKRDDENCIDKGKEIVEVKIQIVDPDDTERRKIRRLALAKKKSESFWGSSLDSDSDETKHEDETKLASKPSKVKRIRKKSYEYEQDSECNNLSPPNRTRTLKHPNHPRKTSKGEHCGSETEGERSDSPKLIAERTKKGSTRNTCRTSAVESESEQSLSPQFTTESRSKIEQHTHVNKFLNDNDCYQSECERTSSSLLKPQRVDKVNQRRASMSSIDKKGHSYEMIPKVSIRQGSRPSDITRLPDEGLRNLPIQNDRSKTKCVGSPYFEKTVPLKHRVVVRQSSLQCDTSIVDVPVFMITIPPGKNRSTHTEKAIVEDPKHSATPIVQHQEYLSQPSALLSTSRRTPSPSSGGCPGITYKNMVEVHSQKKTATHKKKEKHSEEGGDVLDDVMKSRRFRNRDLELAKKTNQYTSRNGDAASRKGTSTSKR